MVITTDVLYNRFKWESIDMKPDNDANDQNNPDNSASSRQAAERILLSKIDDIYQSEADQEPYNKTHASHVDPQVEQWKNYHTAWQSYYQKYYESYYIQHLSKTSKTDDYFSNQAPNTTEPEGIAEEDIIIDLRHKLLDKVSKSAKEVRKSRHFKPILAGLIVVFIFLFLQYNSFLISNIIAYISPGSIDVQNIVVDPNTGITVDPAPRLIIPKINVDVPVSYDIGNDYDSLKAAMRVGVAHFAVPGANSHPGETGNTVLSGHSSNDLFSPGDYKFIFAQLEKLAVGDTIYANYKSKRYTYIVTDTKVVGPTDVSALVYPTTKPILTLLTCTPVGTATNRLLVISEQISPDPTTSAATSTTSTSVVDSMPGKQPTLIETILEWLSGQQD